MKKIISMAGAFLLLCGTSTRAGMTTVNFDLEGTSTTSNGALTSLSQTKSGLTITIDRVGQPFDIATLASLSGTSAFGSRSLAPTPPGSNFFNINFSQPVTSFSADMGDFGTGISDTLALTAFSGVNGTGTNLGTTSASLPLASISTFAFKTLTINGTSVGSVEFSGGTNSAANSVFSDNFRATFAPSSTGGGGAGGGGSSVPLPAAAYVMPLGLALAWIASRKSAVRVRA